MDQGVTKFEYTFFISYGTTELGSIIRICTAAFKICKPLLNHLSGYRVRVTLGNPLHCLNGIFSHLKAMHEIQIFTEYVLKFTKVICKCKSKRQIIVKFWRVSFEGWLFSFWDIIIYLYLWGENTMIENLKLGSYSSIYSFMFLNDINFVLISIHINLILNRTDLPLNLEPFFS